MLRLEIDYAGRYLGKGGIRGWDRQINGIRSGNVTLVVVSFYVLSLRGRRLEAVNQRNSGNTAPQLGTSQAGRNLPCVVAVLCSAVLCHGVPSLSVSLCPPDRRRCLVCRIAGCRLLVRPSVESQCDSQYRRGSCHPTGLGVTRSLVNNSTVIFMNMG